LVIEVYLLDAAEGPGDQENVFRAGGLEAGLNGRLVAEVELLPGGSEKPSSQ